MLPEDKLPNERDDQTKKSEAHAPDDSPKFPEKSEHAPNDEFETHVTLPDFEHKALSQSLVKVESCQAIGQGTWIFSDYETRARVEIQVHAPKIFRVRLAPQGGFLGDFSYALREDYHFDPPAATLAENDQEYRIQTQEQTCVVRKDNFAIRFERPDGKKLNEDLPGSTRWVENTNSGGFYVHCSKIIGQKEQFFGLGDKAHHFNLIHKTFSLWNLNKYSYAKYADPLNKSIPFYYGLLDGEFYGLFFDNTYKTHFDFGLGNAGQMDYTAEGGELRYYFIGGPSMADVARRYASLTGTHAMPPLWALGYHQCRWSYYPESRVRQIAETFRERNIPCDAIYLDIDYMDRYKCFTWNRAFFPDPKKMIDDLDKIGFRTIVIIDPGIKAEEGYEVYEEGVREGYFCRRADDYFMEGTVWPGRCQFPDFTNPRVRQWWSNLFEEFVEMGVDGVWNDMNEPEVFGIDTFPDDIRHHYEGERGSHRKAHNVYGMQMARATSAGLKKFQKNKRTFTITRAAYAGVQRHALTWTGDNQATWEHLHLAAVMCQRLNISGVAFCGADIGGFNGHPDAELFTRWIQLGTFTPLMRTHGAGDSEDREPWAYGEETERIVKRFIELRYQLQPYLYTAFWQHHRYGMPILRPLIMIEPEETNFYREDEFGYGDHMLVCPVVEPGQTERKMYLPKGQWYDFWTKQHRYGGEEIEVYAPLDRMPVFVRAGALIPEFPVMQYTNEFEITELTLNLYYGEGRTVSSLYEDHGDTFAYEQDIYLEKTFTQESDETSLTLTQQMEGMFTPRYESYRFRLVGAPGNVLAVEEDGKPVEFQTPEVNQYEFKTTKNFQKVRILFDRLEHFTPPETDEEDAADTSDDEE